MESLGRYDSTLRKGARANVNPDEEDQNRQRRVGKKICLGEMSKAHQAAMPSKPFTGDLQNLRDLHPRKDPNRLPLPGPPPNVRMPDIAPIDFFENLCKTARGTCQTADGWCSDLLKDINVRPVEDEPNPLYGFLRYSVMYASGYLPVSDVV